jgi:3'-5' exoribonuclease
MAEILPFAHAATLPQHYRITHIAHQAEGGGVRSTARIFNTEASLEVTWLARQPDTRLTRDTVVSPRWKRAPRANDRPIEISRLVRLDRPERSLNLFQTLPGGEADVVRRAAALWERLSLPFQELFNALFWDEHRFTRFCKAPGSLSGHHAGEGGTLRHSVEVAETVLRLLSLHQGAHPDVALAAALLHDAGKADEYAPRSRGWTLTDRGRLLGHRNTILEWLAVARSRMRLGLPEAHYLALLHALTATKAPDWAGMRQPQTPEALLLSLADRASGDADLINRCAAEEGGWGQGHPHLRGRPWTVPEGKPRPRLRGMEELIRSIQDPAP